MRKWLSGQEDDGSLHCLGNGKLCAYGQGPNLVQVFGPPYSSPSLFRLDVCLQPGLETQSRREAGSAIWRHEFFYQKNPAGEMIDFVDAELPVLVRRIRMPVSLSMHLIGHTQAQAIANSQRLPSGVQGLLLHLPSGVPIFHTYPFPDPIFHQVLWTGDISAQQDESGLTLTCQPEGEGCLYFCGGPDYPAAIQHADEALRLPWRVLYERTHRAWTAFTHQRLDRALPLPPELEQAADDTAVLIKTQQSSQGAVLAGHNYHLGYVRDQYGVARGLLALGHAAEAEAILRFYSQIWQRHGRIHNAQAAGVDGVFHVHENDAVEITAYLIQQAFDLAQISGEDILAEVFPMLAWAWEAQKPHLVEGMLPFNGDETYVAGGILPRSALNDGSAEATLLFIESGKKLLDYAERSRRWHGQPLEEDRQLLEQVRGQFQENFWRDGSLITNNPLRAERAVLPRFRHGVCERCHAEGRGKGIEWTERSPNGRYLCPVCLSMDKFPAAPGQVYELQSVSLAPFFLRAESLPLAAFAPLVERITRQFEATGQLPSRPDQSGGLSVGYDYGFLLYALTALKHPSRGALARKTLKLADATGAWVEYYQHGQPRGTRCRPWESAINIAALLNYAQTQTNEIPASPLAR